MIIFLADFRPRVLSFPFILIFTVILVPSSPTLLIYVSSPVFYFLFFSASLFPHQPLCSPSAHHSCRLCPLSCQAAPWAFSKLLSISLKPTDAGIAINLEVTGSRVMPDSPDAVSGWPCLITRINLWNTATEEIHGRQTPHTMWGNNMMDGPVMMASSSLTLSPWILVHEFLPAGTEFSQRWDNNTQPRDGRWAYYLLRDIIRITQ